MIYIDRSAVPIPADLVAGGAGPTERVAAEAHYGSGKFGFKFEVYGADSIKAAFTTLFHGKCAYCESRYTKTQPVDVEHWRPKEAVEVESGARLRVTKPGYYWLAADWDNLLPSCIDCNRRRRQYEGLAETGRINLGKKNRFPLADESRRAKAPGEEAGEEPLLLHPCRDRPEEHLLYPEGEESRGVVQAALQQGSPSLKATKSIEVYALNRRDLVLARRELFLDILGRLDTVATLIDVLDSVTDPVKRARTEESLTREMAALKARCADHAEYALLARQIIEPFFAARSA